MIRDLKALKTYNKLRVMTHLKSTKLALDLQISLSLMIHTISITINTEDGGC